VVTRDFAVYVLNSLVSQSELTSSWSKSKAKDTFHDWITATNIHDADKVMSLFDDSIEINSTLFGHLHGKPKVKELLCDTFHAFPNLLMKPSTVIINGKGVIAAEIDFGGQHLGEFKGSPGIGNSFLIRGAFIFNLNASEKITSIRSYYDSRSINRQLEILKI
jgi:steroid delta-isomerase-like uncharacterized protein